jgi:hypothetical protein
MYKSSTILIYKLSTVLHDIRTVAASILTETNSLLKHDKKAGSKCTVMMPRLAN